MNAFSPELDWVTQQHGRMCDLVREWCAINSGSRNIPGLAKMTEVLRAAFQTLGQVRDISMAPEVTIDNTGRHVQTALGDAISVRVRPDAPVRVFLCIHMDTVYPPEHPFQHVRQVNSRTLNGPGVADAKGGLVVMLIALEALNRSPLAGAIGYEVLINPDEELGSPGSAPLLADAAKRNHLGLVFEPAMADGAMVSSRKGSGNFSAIIRGKSTHAGRDFQLGRNAVTAGAHLISLLDQLNGQGDDVTINIGRVDGGGPVNVVPELAIVRFNIRVPSHPVRERIEAELLRIVQQVNHRDGISAELFGGFTAPPWPVDPKRERLIEEVNKSATELGLTIPWRPSGGVSDANKLAAAGLPVIDNLGPCGGNLHSSEEFLLTDTLVPRAMLATMLLLKVAAGNFPLQ